MRDHPTHSLPPDAAADLRVGIAVSRYHAPITERLLEGAREVFRAAGGRPDGLVVVDVPGAWELVPVAAAMLARGDLDGVVALGLILTGETTHDRWLATGVATGLAELSARHVVPVAFGVLTCQHLEQAEARAGGAAGNKGREAMESTLGAIAAIRQVRMSSAASAEARPAGGAP